MINYEKPFMQMTRAELAEAWDELLAECAEPPPTAEEISEAQRLLPESFYVQRQRPKCWVYFIQRDTDGPIKIGISNDIGRRLSTLQISSPEPLKVLVCIPGERAEEIALHGHFKQYVIAGEWFFPADPLLRFIETCRLLVRPP